MYLKDTQEAIAKYSENIGRRVIIKSLSTASRKWIGRLIEVYPNAEVKISDVNDFADNNGLERPLKGEYFNFAKSHNLDIFRVYGTIDSDSTSTILTNVDLEDIILLY